MPQNDDKAFEWGDDFVVIVSTDGSYRAKADDWDNILAQWQNRAFIDFFDISDSRTVVKSGKVEAIQYQTHASWLHWQKVCQQEDRDRERQTWE